MGLKINEFVGGFSFVNIFSLKNCFTFQIQHFKKNMSDDWLSIQPHCLDFMSIVYLNKA